MMDVHYSSKTDLWATPQDLFDSISKEHGPFDLDVCATADNAKCSCFFTKDQDGLSKTWAPSTCWMNPPYGREIGKWIKKAYEESMKGAKVVCLVPARTDTAWWHDYVLKSNGVLFLRGRVKFGNSRNSAPFPSAVVVFGGAKGKGHRRIYRPRLVGGQLLVTPKEGRVKLKVGQYNDKGERQIDAGRRTFVQQKNAWGFEIWEVCSGADAVATPKFTGQFKYSYQAHAAIKREVEGG